MQLSAEEKFLVTMGAVVEEHHHEVEGTVPPVNLREVCLVEVLMKIADGDIRTKNARVEAAQVLDLWNSMRRDAPVPSIDLTALTSAITRVLGSLA